MPRKKVSVTPKKVSVSPKPTYMDTWVKKSKVSPPKEKIQPEV